MYAVSYNKTKYSNLCVKKLHHYTPWYTIMLFKGSTLLYNALAWNLSYQKAEDLWGFCSNITHCLYATDEKYMRAIIPAFRFFFFCWHLQKEMISSLKNPKDDEKRIVDVDWGSSNTPLVLTADGCLRLFDLSLKTCTSPFESLDSQGSHIHTWYKKNTG